MDVAQPDHYISSRHTEQTWKQEGAGNKTIVGDLKSWCVPKTNAFIISAQVWGVSLLQK